MNNYTISDDAVVFDCGCEFKRDGYELKFNPDLHDPNHTVNFDCPATYKILQDGLTEGVFQLGSPDGKNQCKKLIPQELEHISAIGAIIRPGCKECLSADSKISIKRYHREGRKFHTKKITIKELYDTFKRQHVKYTNHIVSYNEDTQEFFDNRIVDVYYKGVQPTYKVHVRIRKYGQNDVKFYNLRCTENHRFLVHGKGWLRLYELKRGDRIAVINNLERNKKPKTDKFVKGEKTFGNLCFYNYEYRCVCCDWQDGSLDVNHLEGNRKTNNNIDNLCFLCPNHHRMYHEGKITKEEILEKRKTHTLKNTRYVYWAEYAGNSYYKDEDVYDIEVEGPYHNFVAGNFIVHNSKDKDGINITTRYQRKKNGKMELTSYHPVVDSILSKTYGENIYQESSLDLAKQCAGFSLSEADSLRKCVTDDTMFVSRTRGWISIKELLETNYNDDFLIMDDRGEQSWKKISKIWCTGKHDVIEVETNNGLSVKATKHHQFLTNEGWKARIRLQPEDWLVCANKIDFCGYDKICKNLCMVIAGLVTEGYFVEENGSHFTNFDQDMMRVFVENFESYFGHRPSTQDPKVAKINDKDKKIINNYLSFGKSAIKKLPQDMMRTTKETCRHFLSFMLSAEGGVTENTGVFEFSSSSRELIGQVQLLLKRFNIRSNIITKKKSGYKDKQGQFVDCGPSYRLYIIDVQDQQLLLEQLSLYFPDYKKNALKNNIDRKDIENYSCHLVPPNITKKLLNQYPYLGNHEGGSIYKSNITRKKFNRLCEKSGDKQWITFSQGKHYYDTIDNMSKKSRQVLTYDFSMEDENTPYIIANGIVIHNSIGKKIPEELAKSKKLFMEKGKTLGLFTEDQLKEIFNWIEASQRYSFNHSHSWSYGLNSYVTAYQKAHFPLQFYKDWLKNEDKRENYVNFVNEAKLFDIEVKPPDLRDYRLDFYSKGQNVYFGLSNIKGIQRRDIDRLGQIFAEREWSFKDLGVAVSWTDMMRHVLDNISSKSAEVLIKSGALDCFQMDRATMIYEYERFSELSATEKEKFTDQPSLVGLLQQVVNDYEMSYKAKLEEYHQRVEKRRTSTRKTKKAPKALELPKENRRLAKVRQILQELQSPVYIIQDSVDSVIFAEEELLGVALTRHKTDEIINAAETATCLEILNGKKGHNVLRVKVENCRPYQCKNGSTMAFVEVSDRSGRLSVVIFGKKNENDKDGYEEYQHLLTRGSLCFISGSLDKDSFIIKRVYSIS